MSLKTLVLASIFVIGSIADETRIRKRRSTRIDSKIVGGTAAAYGQFPYQVQLTIASSVGTYLCGGTLVSTSFVVTAAHCVTNEASSTSGPVFMSGLSVSAIAGKIDRTTSPSTMQTRNASNVLAHAKYSSDSMLNDLAVLYFKLPFVFTSAVAALPLPAQGTAFAGGTKCIVSGWGGSISDVLLYASVSVVDFSTCFNATTPYGLTVYPSMLCTSTTNNTDTCQGDSGGPVACAAGGTTYLAGVVSSGIGCAEGIPATNTYVSAFSNVINATISNVEANGGLYSGTDFKATNTKSGASSQQSLLHYRIAVFLSAVVTVAVSGHFSSHLMNTLLVIFYFTICSGAFSTVKQYGGWSKNFANGY